MNGMGIKPKVLFIGGAAGIILLVLAVIAWFVFPPRGDLRVQRTASSIEAISEAYQDYVKDNGSLPSGLNNFTLSESMLGANGSRKMYLGMEPGDMNAQGEMVDEWGTPYRITYVSATKVRVISAGPDGKFGTPDDLSNE